MISFKISRKLKYSTPLWKETQDRFWIPARILVANDSLGRRLQKNMKIEKIYMGTLTLLYIYTKKLFSIINKIFC